MAETYAREAWISEDAVKLMQWECSGCKEKLRIVLPISVTTMGHLGDAFSKAHADCEAGEEE